MAQFFDLVLRCPHCISAGAEPGPAGAWYHTGCGGTLQIGEDATYRCKSCSYTAHVKGWRYACEHHADYRPASSAGIASAVSTAGQITGIAGRQWLMTFLENLGDW